MNYWPSEQTIVNEYQVMTIPWDELLTKLLFAHLVNNSSPGIVITWYSVTIVCSLGQ
jgi:hypothetical protein